MLTRLIPGRNERLFERFRRTGDPAALAAVFDRTAAELSRLAARLAPEPGLAQDLLQETFLSAIEAAESWDRARRLEPWLVGILVREARLLRRREGRAVDPARLIARSAPDPMRLAEEGEFARALGRALDALPAKYRDVLVLHLVAEKPALEIARELGRTPGAVRVQIHRGLALLRKALPAGFAAAGALASLSPSGLAEVRAHVLRAGRATGAGLAPGGASWFVWSGAIVMKKLGLAALIALVVGAVLWFAHERSASSPTLLARAATTPAPREDPALAPDRETAASQGAQAPDESNARMPLHGTDPAAAEPAGTGLRGRLVEPDGAPVAGMDVVLLELAPQLFEVDPLAALDGARAQPDPVLARTRTDAGGRFHFSGALARAVHALGIDLGGRRAALRILEEALRTDEALDLGDVVLAAHGELAGRVVDPAGQPIRGARVRAADLPEPIAELELERLRGSSLLVMLARRNEPAAALELPAWMRGLIDLLPVPTAITDAEGRFALEPPSSTVCVLVVDDPRCAPLVRTDLAPLAAGERRELGDLLLPAGRSLGCRVLDPAGVPLAGLEVFAGSLARGRLAVCERAQPGGEAGLYTREGGSDSPEIFAVRTGPEMPWFVAGPFEGHGMQTLHLPAPCTLTLEVRDEHEQPVVGLELALLREDSLSAEESTSFLGTWRNLTEQLRRVDETTLTLQGLAPGRYAVFARAAGLAPLHQKLAIEGQETRARLVFHAARTLLVHALDDASGAPVPGVRISARLGERGRYVAAGAALTNAAGEASLVRVDPASTRDELEVRAQCAGYALAALTVAAGRDAVELRLVPASSLIGRIHCAGQPPPQRYLIALQPRADELRSAGNLPWHALSDADGRFRIADLPDGRFQLELSERFLDGDPLPILAAGRFGQYFDADKGILENRVLRSEIEIPTGKEARFELDLSPAATGRTAALRGRLAREGRGLAGVEVHLDVKDVRALRVTDGDGSFDFGPVAAGKVRLKLEDPRQGFTLYRTELELADGEQRELELAFDPFPADVRLLQSSGEPVPEATLVFEAFSRIYAAEEATARTAADGRCRVVLPGPGSYRWRADAHGAHATGELDVLAGQELALPFRPIVPLAGRVELDPALLGQAQHAFLSVRALPDGPSFTGTPTEIDLAHLTFSVADIVPGRYELTAVCDERWSKPVEVEVPAEGVRDECFVFETR